MSKEKKIVQIGNASGFWGDDPYALQRQLKERQLDYVTADYLAEVSMSILRKQQNRNPELGYVADFLEHIELAIEEFRHSQTKIVTNAGGNNPVDCAIHLQKFLTEKGIRKKVVVITGDNLLERVDDILEKGVSFNNLEDGREFSEVSSGIQSLNVYTGSQPIVEALRNGADVVIAGRISDSAMTIGPLVYEFDWSWNDWDKLSAAMIAGHIIECGSQATGGNFSDWRDIENWEEMAFPIIEMEETGDFIVTKQGHNGGLVNEFTVKEQLVYEIADPEFYYGPDVIADITSISVKEIGEGRVKVSSAKGKPAPPTWKVSMAYIDGFKASGSLIISGPDALKKARLTDEIFRKRLGIEFEKFTTNFIGYNACHKQLAKKIEPNEILIQFNVFDHDRKKVDKFAKMLSSLILSVPQGIAVTGGRPKIQEVMRYWPALVPRELIFAEIVEVNSIGETDKLGEIFPETQKEFSESEKEHADLKTGKTSTSVWHQPVKAKLQSICLARSGDKGNMVNIGVLARSTEIYPFLKTELTANKVKKWFESLCEGEVKRYELDNLNALNFTLSKALDGGGTYSGRIDPQGKTFAAALLNIEMEIPENLMPIKK